MSWYRNIRTSDTKSLTTLLAKSEIKSDPHHCTKFNETIR